MTALQQPETGSGRIFYRGRPLSQAEAFGLTQPRALQPCALPLVVTGWLCCIIVFLAPFAGLATLVATPLLCALFNRAQPAGLRADWP